MMIMWITIIHCVVLNMCITFVLSYIYELFYL